MSSSEKPIRAPNKIARPPCPKCGKDSHLVMAMPDEGRSHAGNSSIKCLACGFEHETRAPIQPMAKKPNILAL
jgi:predicted RNA-binding Zn-ribbon protein involved in translation (DUF1610 family)